MQSIRRTLRLPSAALVLALAAMVAYQLFAQRTPTGSSGGCGCVVTVNLPAVLEGLNERSDAELELEQLAQGMRAEDARRQEQLKAMNDRLVNLTKVDEEARTALEEEMTLEALEYQAWRAYAMEQLDIEKSLMLRDLSRKIEQAIAEMARLNGYDIVLMDDSNQQLGVNPESQISREVQVKQQMSSRRALYVSEDYDISTELIQRMNNAFQTGG